MSINTPITAQHITGLILAGGRGSRMGYLNKGLQEFCGKPLAQHVIERLSPQVSHIILNVNQDALSYQKFGLPMVSDSNAGDVIEYAGPLAGIRAGLRLCTSPYLLCVPCDAPYLSANLGFQLAAALTSTDADIAVATTRNLQQQWGREPVFALMKTSVLADLERFLLEGGRKVGAWQQRLNTVDVAFEDAQAFRNFNTLQDLMTEHVSG